MWSETKPECIDSCQCAISRKNKTNHIAWIWSSTSVAFALFCMKASTSWSSCSPPASKPGESWKMKCGLLLKENWSWTLWIPRYGIKVNDLIREMCKDRTFEVGLICRRGDDESGYKAKQIYYLAVTWIFLCITDPLEQRRFTSIRPPDNKDTEVGVLGSEFRSFFFWVGRYRWSSGC